MSLGRLLPRALLLRWPRAFVRLHAPDDSELGRLGEEVAARHLVGRGFRVLGRNVRTPHGEADLVVASRDTFAVVEVKTGRGSCVPRPRRTPPPCPSEGPSDPLAALDLRWRPGSRCDARRLARLRAVLVDLRSDRSSRRDGRAARVDLLEVFLLERDRRFVVIEHQDIRRPLTDRAGPPLLSEAPSTSDDT